ncbi:hypothetical protein ACFL6C_05545 [Myxococcota bacterium]
METVAWEDAPYTCAFPVMASCDRQESVAIPLGTSEQRAACVEESGGWPNADCQVEESDGFSNCEVFQEQLVHPGNPRIGHPCCLDVLDHLVACYREQCGEEPPQRSCDVSCVDHPAPEDWPPRRACRTAPNSCVEACDAEYETCLVDLECAAYAHVKCLELHETCEMACN